MPMLSVPVSEKVSLLEFDVPEIVTDPPALATVAVASIDTNSDLPDCVIVSVFESTPDAEKVAVVVLELLPVCSDADHDTVSSPEPDVLLGVTQDAYAIIL